MHPIDTIRKFARLTPELEQSLLEVMRERTFRRGEIIQGVVHLTSYALFIKSGAARVFYTVKSREHTVEFAFEDDFVVVPAHYVHAHGDTLTLQFLEPTTVIFIPHLKVKEQLDESGIVDDTESTMFVSAALLQHVTVLEERLEVMQTYGADERYRWILQRYPRITECANATQIASFLGITKETLYRIRGGKYGKHDTPE